MKILYISTFFPYPPDNGARIRIYHLINALSKKHEVHLVTFLPSENEQRFLEELHFICERVDYIERDPFWRDPRRRVSAHLSLTPRDILRGRSPEMENLVFHLSKDKRFDTVIASTMEAGKYALKVSDSPRILEEQNFLTQWMMERYRMQKTWPRNIAGWVTWQKCQRYERWLYPQFEAVTMVSDHDQQAVRKYIPGFKGRLEVIPNGVDLDTHKPGMAEPIPGTMVYNGSLTYAANLDAMQYFSSAIWPIIMKSNPEARLTITGRTEGVDLGWLKDHPQVRLSGYLEDIRPTVAGNWMGIAPIRDGSGTRLKILEAMALGTPVVATFKGAEGLEVTHGKDILIADEPEDFAGQCVRLLDSPTLREEIAKNARNLVESRYGWQAIGDRFCDLIEEVSEEYTRKKVIL